MPFYTSFSELIPQIQDACKSRKGFSRLTSIRLPIRLILKTKMPKPQALTARSALTAVAPGAEPGTRRRLRSCPTAASEAARSLQPPSRPRSPRGGRLAWQDEQEDRGTGEAAELSLAKPLLPLSRWLQTGRAWRMQLMIQQLFQVEMASCARSTQHAPWAGAHPARVPPSLPPGTTNEALTKH